MGGSYLIVVDAHSRWPEVHHMPRLNKSLGDCLQEEQLVSDNGPFQKQNRIKPPITPLPMAKLRGLFVHLSKQSLLEREGQSLDQTQDNFLLMYRTTPHATTGESPCKLFMEGWT